MSLIATRQLDNLEFKQQANVNFSSDVETITGSDEDFVDHSQLRKTSRLPLFVAKIIGFVKDLFFSLGTLYSRFNRTYKYDTVIGNPASARGIAVLIHGLNAHPSQMDGHADALRKSLGDKVLIYQVQVEKLGNCSKTEALEKIKNTVLPILQTHPNMKLYAHGISNGGWLASKLSVELLQDNIYGSRMMVNSNSSPLYGTKVMRDPTHHPIRQRIWRTMLKIPLLTKGYTDDIYNDFSWGSESGKQMITKIRHAAEQGVKFEFDGGFADAMVTPPSFFPKDVFNATYFYPQTIEGHSSIIASQRKRQVTSASAFIMANE